MSETLERLKPELARLTDDERADLAYFLLTSLDADEDADEKEHAFSRELLEHRAAELRSGDVVGVPGEDVLERLRKKYP